MTLENIILTGFVCAAIACGYLLFLFFKPRGDRTPPPLTWRRWTAGNALIILFLAALVLAAGEVYYRFFQDDTDAYMLTKISRRWLRRHYQINRSEVRDPPNTYGRSSPASVGSRSSAIRSRSDMASRMWRTDLPISSGIANPAGKCMFLRKTAGKPAMN